MCVFFRAHTKAANTGPKESPAMPTVIVAKGEGATAAVGFMLGPLADMRDVLTADSWAHGRRLPLRSSYNSVQSSKCAFIGHRSRCDSWRCYFSRCCGCSKLASGKVAEGRSAEWGRLLLTQSGCFVHIYTVSTLCWASWLPEQWDLSKQDSEETKRRGGSSRVVSSLLLNLHCPV